MEWSQILPISLSVLTLFWSAVWTVYVFRRGRKDKKIEIGTEIEKAHLTDAATLRHDLYQMLKEANQRIDELEAKQQENIELIFDLRTTIGTITHEKVLLEKEKLLLEQELEQRTRLFESELAKKASAVEALNQRITELEAQVELLKSHG